MVKITAAFGTPTITLEEQFGSDLGQRNTARLIDNDQTPRRSAPFQHAGETLFALCFDELVDRRSGAVVKRTRWQHAAMAKPVARPAFPVPGSPIRRDRPFAFDSHGRQWARMRCLSQLSRLCQVELFERPDGQLCILDAQLDRNDASRSSTSVCSRASR